MRTVKHLPAPALYLHPRHAPRHPPDQSVDGAEERDPTRTRNPCSLTPAPDMTPGAPVWIGLRRNHGVNPRETQRGPGLARAFSQVF